MLDNVTFLKKKFMVERVTLHVTSLAFQSLKLRFKIRNYCTFAIMF
jgi:hypothetical protein